MIKRRDRTNFRLLLFVLVMTIPVLALAQTQPQVIHLWKNGAPGFEDRKDEEELAKDWWIKNVHNPSITVFLPPKDKATGAAIERSR